eukprot:jgi/Psemu1/252652/estExt_Genewise1Plus.C_530049
MDASDDAMPQSVEEAGALLGAAITRYGKGSFETTPPPKGIHSSFTVISPVPSSEFFDLLHTLRSLLRSAPKNTPLVAAPSLLAGVLMKLLGISSSLASSISSNDNDPTKPRNDVPPMLSTAIRRVWVDCVVLCHSLGEGLSGAQRINLYGFVRDMIILAGLNPRTARALGGTRVAALEVMSGLLEDPKLSAKLSSWAFDIAQLCQRALKSSGNGEPTYRIAAIRVACSVAVASRNAFLKTRDLSGSAQFVLKGALEDKAIFEMIKVLKIAVQDKYPEVRSSAARLSCLLGPVSINLHIKSPSSPDAQATSPTSCLEEIMTLAFRNLDDESAHVSEGWAEALARCMCTTIEFKSQAGSERGRGETSSSDVPEVSTGRGGKKGMLSARVCSTLPNAIKYLVSVFIKVGGELTAPRAGGSFSRGGRAIRAGFARSIIHLLRLQLQIQSIGEGRSLSFKESILIILAMVGNDMEKQLNPTSRGAPKINYLDATTVVTSRIAFSSGSSAFPATPTGRNLFGQGPKVSHADGCIARLLTNQVLRSGLTEQMTELSQLKLLHELIDLCSNKQNALKGNQLQVILVEISHLFATLGEATASSVEESIPGLFKCLRHSNHGVRHEAAVACAAIASVFPSEGRKVTRDCIQKIQMEHAELMTAASDGGNTNSNAEVNTPSRFRFGRESPAKKKATVDGTLKHQYAIHGMSLMVALVIRDLPSLPGGLPPELLDTAISVSEILISTPTNEVIMEVSPSSICTCVRAGFCLVSGALSTGPKPVSDHIALIFGLWQKVCKAAQSKDNFTADHEMMCVEALLTSIVAFLKFCSELILSIPDALSRTSLILENLLPLFFSKGRLGSTPANPAAACRLDSAKASIMEAFAWLPPGSFPMIADSVFGFAASHIQSAIQNDVSCSILPSLISKEDGILDTVSFDRANELSQVGGARDLGRDIITLTSEVAHHGDRESAFSFIGYQNRTKMRDENAFLDSQVLGLLDVEGKEKPITVLHQVGTWRKPVNPSSATRIRLVDAAVQAFASTFALRSGKEQQQAMDILQSLLPPLHLQKGRNSGSADQDRSRKDNLASATNVAAVILSCVQTLPVDESTHDIPVGLGPSWKTKASTILLSILSSRVSDVRRAAAEGLAILSTLGIKEDMHFLQSSVLHSLDEVILRSLSQGQGRNALQDDAQNGRSGGLLALACIQRSVHYITERRASRSRLRGSPVRSKGENEDSLQTIQIMSRVLPYVSGLLSSGISLNARASALHSILMLLEHSGKMNADHLHEDDLHLLKKAVEIVEENYLFAWTVASRALDQGNQAQKIAHEPSFLSVILRFMTFLTPFLHHLGSYDDRIAKRFSTMAMLIVECYGNHSVVQLEALAFFEVLADNRCLLPTHGGGIKYDEHPILSCIPYLMANIAPNRSQILSRGILDMPHGRHSSIICMRGTLRVLRALSSSQILVAEWSDMQVISVLFAALEDAMASTSYYGETLHRGLAAPREAESAREGNVVCGEEVSDILRVLIHLERVSPKCEFILLRYILLSRAIATGNSVIEDDDFDDTTHTVASVTRTALEQAAFDSQEVFELGNVIRWQVKSIAAQMMTIALMELSTKCRADGMNLEDSENFNPRLAQIECLKACNVSNASDSDSPNSFLALHIPELIASGCVVATATVDQVELRILQENSMYCLANIIDSFGAIPDPDDSQTKMLNEYIPQLSSCIKSALSATDDKIDESTCRLFWAGCNTLRSFIRSQVTDDTAVLKRLIRPVLLTQGEVPFFDLSSTMPKTEDGFDDLEVDSHVGSILLIKLGKLWMLGNIPLENNEISRMIEPEKSCIGVHAATLAIDGARLLLLSNLNLCGELSDKAKIQADDTNGGFFSFRETAEIDDYSKAALAKTWASNAQLSVEFLLNAINSTEMSEIELKSCLEWLERIIPYLFSGLYDAIKTVGNKSYSPGKMAWAEQVDGFEIACSCLAGLRTVSESRNLNRVHKKWKHEIEACAVQIYKFILLPVLVPSKSRQADPKQNLTTEATKKLIINSCDLLKTFSRSLSLEEELDSCPFLATLLSPLDLLEKEKTSLNNDISSLIIATCLNSVAGIIENHCKSRLAKVMSSFALSICEKKSPELVSLASQHLLEICLNHESTSITELSVTTLGLAKSRNWTAWSSVVKIKDGIAAEESLLELEKALLNPINIEEQLGALGAIRNVVQNNPPPNPSTGRILSALGAEVFSLFQAYGTLSNNNDSSSELQAQRVTACTECMKIALASYQQCSTDFSEADITEFLIVLFEVFIAVLRFNGLPNHPPPQGERSDPSIGRMCAQAITHVARTTPIPFKASMGGMSEQDRAVLEFAVRGEMSGYVVARAVAPVKKKLSLKGFSKR